MNNTDLTIFDPNAIIFLDYGNAFSEISSLTNSIAEGAFRQLQRSLANCKDRIVGPGNPFPPEFLAKIEQSNEKLGNNASLALVVYAEEDSNGALTSSASLDNLLEMAKTHRVILKSMNSGSLLGRRIRETSRENGGRLISQLYLAGHGSPDHILFGGKGFLDICPTLETQDLSEQDFDLMEKDAKIHLFSCRAGIQFAAALAKISKHRVQGAVEKVLDSLTVYDDQESNLISYNSKGESIMREFSPDGRSHILSVDEKKKTELFSGKYDRLSSMNTPDSLECLERMEEHGFGKVSLICQQLASQIKIDHNS